MIESSQALKLHIAARSAAWLVIIAGSLSLTLWHSQSAWFLEHALWLFETRHNTALLFVGSAIGLLAASNNQKRIVLGFGIFTLLAGSVTLIQYIIGTSFGIDELFVHDYPHPDMPYPGRPAPNTALAFMAVGAFLLLVSSTYNDKIIGAASAQLIGFLVFALGGAAIAGYLQGEAQAYTWGTFTRMAPLTAIFFMVLGAGFMALGWQRQQSRIASVPLWLPGLLCFLVLLFDISTPFQVAAGFAYIPLIFCSVWFVRPHTAFVFAAIASLLSILGYFSANSDQWWTFSGITNRLMMIGVLWFIAALVYRRHKDEAKLLESQSQLRAVVDHAVDGLITINNRGIIETFNPACERIFGYKTKEVIGQNIKLLMPEPYHSEHDGYIVRYLNTGQGRIIGTTGREVSAKRKDGSIFPIDLAISAFMLEDGQHFSGIIRDITARKEAEERIQRYMRDLERSNKELDDFAYIASHDLKEPLRGIHNHARFLIEDNEGKLDEDSTNRLTRLVYLSQRMEKLVNDLLYFSRLGRQTLAIQPTDLNLVVHDITDTLDVLLEERNAKIIIPQPLPTITCDKPRITEALRNLIVNAIKYNDKQEKIVEIGFLSRYTGKDKPYRNVVYVKDNGMGIASEFHEEVFRIFKRLQTGKDKKEDGTGVGLTFVKKIIERHGGKIWLESSPGQGTTFYFTLEGASYDLKSAA